MFRDKLGDISKAKVGFVIFMIAFVGVVVYAYDSSVLASRKAPDSIRTVTQSTTETLLTPGPTTTISLPGTTSITTSTATVSVPICCLTTTSYSSTTVTTTSSVTTTVTSTSTLTSTTTVTSTVTSSSGSFQVLSFALDPSSNPITGGTGTINLDVTIYNPSTVPISVYVPLFPTGALAGYLQFAPVTSTTILPGLSWSFEMTGTLNSATPAGTYTVSVIFTNLANNSNVQSTLASQVTVRQSSQTGLIVQQVYNTCANAPTYVTSCTVTFTNPVASGDVLVACIGGEHTPGTSSINLVSDSETLVWTTRESVSNGGNAISACYTATATSSGSELITFTTTPMTMVVTADELRSGLSFVSGSTGIGASTTPSVTAFSAYSVTVAMLAVNGCAGVSAGAGYILLGPPAGVGCPGNEMAQEYSISVAGSSTVAPFILGGGLPDTWAEVAMTFG